MTTASRPPFGPAALAIWRRRLEAIRATLVEDLERLRDAQGQATVMGSDSGSGRPRSDDLDEAEQAWELIREVDEALLRVAGRGPCPFGICEATGARIDRRRLDLVPWTRWCASMAMRG